MQNIKTVTLGQGKDSVFMLTVEVVCDLIRARSPAGI